MILADSCPRPIASWPASIRLPKWLVCLIGPNLLRNDLQPLHPFDPRARTRFSASLKSLLALLFVALTCHAQSPSERENIIKADLLRRFLYYVEWPANAFDGADSPIIVGVLGEDPFGNALVKLLDKKVEGREVKVVHFDSVAKLGKCHILYLNLPQRKDAESVLTKLNGQPVLTVADMEGFTDKGGMINIIKRRNHLDLFVNNATARRAGLKISSRLLTAVNVTEP